MNSTFKNFLTITLFLALAATTAFCDTNITADGYVKIGQSKELNGDVDGALAAFNQVLLLNANVDESSDMTANVDDSIARIARDMLQLARGDLDGALANYRKDKSPDAIGFGMESCYIWVIQNKQGQKQQAGQELSSTLTATASGMFKITNEIDIAEYLVGKMSEDDLIAVCVADDSDTHNGQRNGTLHQGVGMAYYFIGEKHLATGDKAAAINDFRKILSLSHVMADDRILAQAELKALGQSLSAPPTPTTAP